MTTPQALVDEAYDAFNARDLARMRPLIHAQAVWPNTLEDGPPLVGREAVIGHFARIFATMLPNIQLIRVVEETTDTLTVEAQYSVESHDGHVWTDTRATLTYHFRDGLLSGMTIVGGF
ncbi:MAG TPA: nuclear transport factor 2 family protein [Caulobacter sp.]|nr:nuclear transport factor 2 family protein [Caulobacter sp.]